MKVPASLDWWRDVPGGAEWLDSLPRIVDACAERWGLRVGQPFAGGNVSLVVAEPLAPVLLLGELLPVDQHPVRAIEHEDLLG